MKHLALIQEAGLFKKNSVVAVAVSGGADSMALLHCLWVLGVDWTLDLRAIHIHHGLRDASDAEAAFVKGFCEERDIPFEMYQVDVRQHMDQGMSIEEAARVARHQVFRTYAEVNDAVIALGHHMEDQAETVLLNLFRGTGSLGLKGMLPKRNHLCRPLLTTSKQEILTYCETQAIDFVTDESNMDCRFRRNYIRHKILPEIKENLQPEIISSLCRTAAIVREDEAYLNEQAEQAYRRVMRATTDGIAGLDTAELNALPKALKSRVLRRFYQMMTGSMKNLTYDHIRSLSELADAGATGKRLDLPGGITVKKSYNSLYEVKGNAETDHKPEALLIDLEGMVPGSELVIGPLHIRLMAYENGAPIPKNVYTKWFDYDKIKRNLTLRNRLPGDFIYLGQGTHRKKLKNYLIDSKIPAQMRSRIPLIADGAELTWIIGYRASDRYTPDQATKRVLEIAYTKEDL